LKNCVPFIVVDVLFCKTCVEHIVVLELRTDYKPDQDG